MNWKVLKTEDAYREALQRTIVLFHSAEGSAEGDELDLLLVLVKDYEDKNIHLPKLIL